MKDLSQKNVLVLGLGASGMALAHWCARFGAQVTVADTRSVPPYLNDLQSEVPEAHFVNAEMNEALLCGVSFDMVL